MQEQLVIIGSGPAGLTAAIYAARANLNPLLIEGKKPGGQLMGTTLVENWPGNTGIMGPKLMMDMKEHAKAQGTRFLSGMIVDINTQNHPFVLTTDKGEAITAQAVIIATGATPKTLNIPGEQTYWGKGVSTCAVCDGAFFKDQPVVIVGGGDTAMEDASFMTKFTDDITIIHIKDTLTASAAMQARVVNNPKIKIIYNSTVTAIHGKERASSVTVTNQLTKKEQTLKADGVFIAIGYTPNTAMFKGKLELDNWGYLSLKDGTHTSVAGIFAAGDVADYRYRQAITSAGSGCMAALDAQRWLSAQQI